MQIDDDNDTSKSDQSDTSFNTSSASEFHSEDEYIQKSRSCCDLLTQISFEDQNCW